jgi:vanillate O-demethylase monooxygenase subunit
MFGPTDGHKHTTALPRRCSFQATDWHILASFWHPVMYAHEVSDKPCRARLLDVDLVVFRTAEGLAVARDLCPHRGTRLSQGRVDGSNLICPMHGLHFAADGRCTRIPAMGEPQRIPPKLRLQSCLVAERYGLVWACLNPEPIHPLPSWAGLEDMSVKKLFLPSDVWQAAAARHVENFNDLAHFPWVHTGSFGGDKDAPVPRHDVERTDFGLRFSVQYREGANRYQDGVAASERVVKYTYELTYPFATLLIMEPDQSTDRYFLADVVCPESAYVSRIFQVMSDTAGMPDPDHWLKDQSLINDEDRPMVEEQKPEDLPLDLAAEMHIPADRVSLEYRRGLVDRFGLGAPIAS